MYIIEIIKSLFSKQKVTPEPPKEPTVLETDAEDLKLPHIIFYLKDGTVWIKVRWSKEDAEKQDFIVSFSNFMYAVQSGTLTETVYKAIGLWAKEINDTNTSDKVIARLHELLVKQAVEIANSVIEVHEEDKKKVVLLPSEVFGSYSRKNSKRNKQGR